MVSDFGMIVEKIMALAVPPIFLKGVSLARINMIKLYV
jgi:hypothetical protein